MLFECYLNGQYTFTKDDVILSSKIEKYIGLYGGVIDEPENMISDDWLDFIKNGVEEFNNINIFG